LEHAVVHDVEVVVHLEVGNYDDGEENVVVVLLVGLNEVH
jgi:hypothetical protein